MTQKIDYKRELSHLYKASPKKIAQVDVPEMQFLQVDGKGDPNTSVEFSQGAEALFGLSYTLKFMIKKSETAIDYGVLPLEGLWWAEDPAGFSMERRENWRWRLMVMQPDLVTSAAVSEASGQLKARKNPVALPQVRFETFAEGRSVQMLHMGPYDQEGPTIERLMGHIAESGLTVAGKHHEIYLSDPRRTAPEKIKTIIRYPVA